MGHELDLVTDAEGRLNRPLNPGQTIVLNRIQEIITERHGARVLENDAVRIAVEAAALKNLQKMGTIDGFSALEVAETTANLFTDNLDKMLEHN